MLHLIVCSALLLGASDGGVERMGVAQSDVERAARDFRIQVYQSYRLDRPEYDARREAGDRLLERFVDAGNPKAYQEDVLNWFRTSEELSRSDESAELPELPELPAALPKNLAKDGQADPTRAPHLPGFGRLNIEIPTSAQQAGQETDFLGTPTPVQLHEIDGQKDDSGMIFPTKSKILRSIQRALISSATMDHTANHDDEPADAAEPSPKSEGDGHAKSSVGGDPFAPRDSSKLESLFPPLDQSDN
jgi:hypothetical protein